MAKQIEVKIGGEDYLLCRSWASARALLKRFGAIEPNAILAGKSQEEQLGFIPGIIGCLLRDKTGKPVPEPAEGWDEWLDIGDIQAMQGMLALFTDKSIAEIATPDPRSLAPYVPSPEALVRRMLDVADLQPGEKLIDPCCGDGRVLVEAVARGAVADGYELDTGRTDLARKAIAGTDCYVFNDDGMNAEFSEADVVFLYTMPDSNRKLQPILLAQCKDNCRVLSHAFDMPGWPKAHSETFEGKYVFHMWRMGDVRAALSSAAA